MWYTTLIMIFFHHIVIFFERLLFLFRIFLMKHTHIMYLRGSFFSSSVKGITPDIIVLRGNTLLCYKFLTYPKKYSQLWFRNQNELLVIRHYYLLGYPRTIQPDQKKLPYDYQDLFVNKLGEMFNDSFKVIPSFAFVPSHFGVKFEDRFISSGEQLWNHAVNLSYKSIVFDINHIQTHPHTLDKRLEYKHKIKTILKGGLL